LKEDIIFCQFKADEDDVQKTSINPNILVLGEVGVGRGFKMLNNEKSNDNLTMLDRLKIANSLLKEIDDKHRNFDDFVFYSSFGEIKKSLPENIKEEYAKVTENYVKGITRLIKEVSELPVVD